LGWRPWGVSRSPVSLISPVEAQVDDTAQVDETFLIGPLDIFLSYQPALVRRVLETYLLTLLGQISRFIPSILKVIPSSVLFLLRPSLNIIASITGILFSIPTSILLYIPRAIGIPLSIPIHLITMLAASVFDPLIKGLIAEFQSVEQIAVVIQELFLTPVLPALSLTGLVRGLIYGNPLASLLTLLLFPLRIPQYLLALPLWPLKAIATVVELVSIMIMIPLRIPMIPLLIGLNLFTYLPRAAGYVGYTGVLYVLNMIVPPEIRTALIDLTTLPQRIGSFFDSALYRILVFPLYLIMNLLRSIPAVGRIVEPVQIQVA